MSLSRQFGQIKVDIEGQKKLLANYNLHWVIPNVRNSPSPIGTFDESSHFFLGVDKEYEWTLDIFFAGFDDQTRDFVGIRAYLYNFARHEGKYFTVKFSIFDKNGKSYSTKFTQVEGDSGIVPRFILKDDLFQPDLLPNDELTIVCEIFEYVDIKLDEDFNTVHLSGNNPLEKFNKLLGNNKFSDFKLFVKEKEFCVHRAIVATLSPVFEKMFDSKMREANEGEAHIDDVEPEVMETLLHFIYTGKMDVEDLADKVLVAAEKYQVESLKLRCENILAKKLSFDNIYDVLNFANQNNASNLKKKAIKLFDKNLKTLREAKNFKESVNSLSGDLKTEIICIRAFNDE